MPRSKRAGSGLFALGAGGFLILAMGIIHSSQSTHVSGSTTEAEATEDPRQRGLDYEDHVFDDSRLPREIRLSGGELQLHPRLWPPKVSVPARYYRSPQGFDGGALLDRTPHAKAIRDWAAALKGGFRVPDAIATHPGGRRVLYELKCPSPWLTFGGGLAWVAKMQAGFASQAVAFLSWAAQRPERRHVIYGFCGHVPPWALSILKDLRARFPIATVDIQEAFRAKGFEPGDRLVRKALRDAMLGALGGFTHAELLGAAFDRMKD